MKQVEQMEDEVEKLKAKLRETQQRLEVEREAEKLRRERVRGEDTAACLGGKTKNMGGGEAMRHRTFLKHR